MPRSHAPFVSGWRAVAVNLLSGSVVVIALSSTVTGVSGAQVSQPAGTAPGIRVQLGVAPVTVDLPESAATAYVDLDLSGTDGRPAVLEGLARAAVEACSTPWSQAGTCPGRRLRLAVGSDGRLSGAQLAPLAHLKVSARDRVPFGTALVLRTGPLEVALSQP